MSLRLIGLLAILGVLAASSYTLVKKAARRPASAQYVLGIVAGQLAQVQVLDGTYDAQLDFREFSW